MTGESRERAHVHYPDDQKILMRVGVYSIYSCWVCGHYIIVENNRHRQATGAEMELITELVYPGWNGNDIPSNEYNARIASRAAECDEAHRNLDEIDGVVSNDFSLVSRINSMILMHPKAKVYGTEYPSDACEGCKYLQNGCMIPGGLCKKRAIGGTIYNIGDLLERLGYTGSAAKRK